MYMQIGKRVLDLFLAAFLLTFLLPILTGITLAIVLDSPGPVLFRQKRRGRDRNGSPTSFPILKFRTMVVGAERRTREVQHLFPADSHRQAPAGQDPRVTCVGQFLRNTGLDELPQLWNILVGHMSFVGPRPKLPQELRRYGEENRHKRQGIRPGLTGLDQLSLKSGKTGVEVSLALDLQYVERVSFMLDLRTIVQTAFLILRALTTRWTLAQEEQSREA